MFILFVLGNVGGYLGLFLGYAALNVPDLAQQAFNWFAQLGKQRKTRQRPYPTLLQNLVIKNDLS